MTFWGCLEVCWTGSGETEDKSIIFFSGQSSKHKAGVGMFLCKRAQQALPVSERIMSARFLAQPIDISVIRVYAPTADSSDEEVKAYLHYSYKNVWTDAHRKM